MGRSNDALRKANDSIRDIVAPVKQEVINTIMEVGSEETIVATHAVKYPLNGLDKLFVYLHAKVVNLVNTDTLTFKFYIREPMGGVDDFSEINQSANYTVLTTGVTAGQVKRFDVDDTDEIIKSATHYSVATTAGIETEETGLAKLQVGKSLAV